MKGRFLKFSIVLTLLALLSCASENERALKGKWTLAGRMMGGTPSSFWFKGNGTVIAPWEKHKYIQQSRGTYEFIKAKQLKIDMRDGFYKGNIYFFDVVKITEKELILRNNFEDVKLKKAE